MIRGDLADSLRQPERQGLDHLLRSRWDVVRDTGTPFEFAQQTVKKPRHGGALRSRPEVVLEDEVRRLGVEGRNKVSKKGGLAGAPDPAFADAGLASNQFPAVLTGYKYFKTH